VKIKFNYDKFQMERELTHVQASKLFEVSYGTYMWLRKTGSISIKRLNILKKNLKIKSLRRYATITEGL